jgi:hypothetical protein
MNKQGFAVTQGKGFALTFSNGWTVSVQFGPGNYCENRATDFDAPRKAGVWQCATAEIAAWDRNRIWHSFGDDEVKGYCTPNEVLAFCQMIAAKPE